MADGLGFVDAIRTAVSTRGDALAAIFADRRTSWSAMLDNAARIAAGLKALGVQPGDRVAVLSANSDHYMTLYLAIPWAGAVIAPLNARWSPVENAFALDDCKPAAIFVGGACDAATLAIFDERAADVPVIALDDAERQRWRPLSDLLSHDPVQDAGRAGDDLFGIFYTGGTTGRSKGVMLSHASILNNALAMRDVGMFPDDGRSLIVAPLFHMAAVAALAMGMLSGGTVVILPAFDPARTADVIATEDVTDALLVPTMMQMILDAPGVEAAKLKPLQRIMYGASPMPEATLDRIMTAAPHTDFFQCYGMTELSPTAVMLPPEMHRGEHRAAGRHRGAGKPLAGVEVMVADADGKSVLQGEVGEILVRGSGVMLGYWEQPEQTAQALANGWMHTGDGGRFDDHGVLYVVDRMKDMIVSGGENVYSAEVESALSQHPDVLQCAVIGVPDARWGERVHAAIVARPGATIDADGVMTHCRKLIADYKCPRSVEVRASLPMSAAGKILKAELRKPHWEGQGRNVA